MFLCVYVCVRMCVCMCLGVWVCTSSKQGIGRKFLNMVRQIYETPLAGMLVMMTASPLRVQMRWRYPFLLLLNVLCWKSFPEQWGKEKCIQLGRTETNSIHRNRLCRKSERLNKSVSNTERTCSKPSGKREI